MNEIKPCLDVACGSRMFWFDKNDERAVFADKRQETHTLCDGRVLNINPDIVDDFRKLPFPSESFSLVVFDPPHLVRIGGRSWMALKYGKLGEDWQNDIKQGFQECFRVLKPFGVLIFKWSENQISIKEILALTPEKPLFGDRRSKTHWITFMRGEQQ